MWMGGSNRVLEDVVFFWGGGVDVIGRFLKHYSKI